MVASLEATLLAWIGGAASTVAGSWFTNKIHLYYESRRAHLEDIKTNVLMPIRKELGEYEVFVFNRQPLFSVMHTTTGYRDDVPLTESPLQAERVLTPAFPTGWLFRGTEPALTEDVRTNHFPDAAAALNQFVMDWASYTGECQFRVRRLANEILERSGLPKFPNAEATEWPSPYVMHLDLALLVYMRCFRFATSTLTVQHVSGSNYSSISSDNSMVYAIGPEELLNKQLECLNALLSSERQTAERLLNQVIKLQEQFARVRRLLDLAIASHRLRKRCDLVRLI